MHPLILPLKPSLLSTEYEIPVVTINFSLLKASSRLTPLLELERLYSRLFKWLHVTTVQSLISLSVVAANEIIDILND